jgi:hypothetical protein
MRLSALLLLAVAGILISGCSLFHKSKAKAPAPAPMAPSVIITPDMSVAAKVVSYNPTGRFVVLNFPVGQMPEVGQSFFLYRGGLKSGEIKISGPQRDNNIVADLVNGDAQPGDEVRDQ